MKIPNILNLRLIVALLAGCLSASLLHGQTNYNITVKSGPLRQSLRGFGASHASTYWNNINATARSTMADMVYRDLNMNVFRMWVTTTDDKTVADMLAEFNTRYVASGAIADVTNRGVNTLLLAPARGGGTAPPASVSTYATNLAELILQIKNTYGITINVTGIANEPEGTWNATQIIDCVNNLRTQLNARGLSAVGIVAPESSNPSSAAASARAMHDNGTAWNNLFAMGSHSYGMLTNDDLENYKQDKQWWITEAAGNDVNEVAEDENQACTILARFLCEMNHGVDEWIFFIGMGQVADITTYQLGTAFMVLYDVKTASVVPLLKYYYFKQALNGFNRGCIFRKCVSATEGDMFATSISGTTQHPAINAAAAVNPDGSWGISLQNDTGVTGSIATGKIFYPATTYNVTVTVEELASTPSANFTIYRSRANNHFVTSGTVTLTNGVGTVTVASRELVTLRSGSAALTAPPVPAGLYASNINAPVSLNWHNTARAASWKVKRATVSGGPYTVIDTTTDTHYDDETAANGTVYYYVVSAVNAAGESANSAEVASTPAPFPWTNADIGNVTIPGYCTVSDDGTFTDMATGTSLGYNCDSFNYTYQTMTGNGTLIARIAKPSLANTKVGIMMSETLGIAPKAVYLLYNFNSSWNQVMMSRRSTEGASGSWTPSGVTGIPSWVKLTRAGNVFTGYASTNGTNWTTVSSGSIPMASTIYIGLANCATGITSLCKAVFDNVSAPCAIPTGLRQTGALPGKIKLGWTASLGAASYNVKRAAVPGGPYTTIASVTAPAVSCTDSTIAAGTNYYYVVSAVNPQGESPNSAELSTWNNADIGTTALSSTCTIATDGVFTLRTNGTSIGYIYDSYNYTYRMMTGNGTLIARIPQSALANSKVGIMMTETLGNSPKAAYLIYNFNTYWNQVMMSRRSTEGTTGSWNTSGVTGIPSWVKLTRAGNVFTGYASSDGTNWTLVSSGTIPMASTIYAGMGCNSTGTTTWVTATLDCVTSP